MGGHAKFTSGELATAAVKTSKSSEASIHENTYVLSRALSVQHGRHILSN